MTAKVCGVTLTSVGMKHRAQYFLAGYPPHNLSVHRTPSGFVFFFRFAKNAPLRGAAHHACQLTTLARKSALLTFNRNTSTTMPRKSTLNYETRVPEAVQAYNLGQFRSISAAA